MILLLWTLYWHQTTECDPSELYYILDIKISRKIYISDSN